MLCLMQKSKFKIEDHSFHMYKDFKDQVRSRSDATGLCSGGSHFETRHVFLSFLSSLSEWYFEIG
jgi:hypothetical protein